MTSEAINSSERVDAKCDRGDFLDFLKKVQTQKPDRLSDRDLWSALLVNLSVLCLYPGGFAAGWSLADTGGRFAGSDTTAMALRAVFYFLVQNQLQIVSSKRKLMKPRSRTTLEIL